VLAGNGRELHALPAGSGESVTSYRFPAPVGGVIVDREDRFVGALTGPTLTLYRVPE
jgi:hypothetical protein